MEKKFAVIILGAGAAGLSAAERLLRFGINNFVVLEARDRIGGRVYVKEHKGDRIHMGAQWIHQFCPENTMVQVAKKYGMVDDSTPITGGDMNPEEYFDSENVFTSSGRHIPENLVKKAAKIYKLICDLVEGDAESEIVDSDDSTKSVDDLFEKIAQAELTKLSSELTDDEFELVAAALYGYKNGLAHFVCGDLDDCSLEVYAASNTLPGDDIDLPLDLLDSIAKSLPEDSIKLGHVVKNVDWSDEENIKVTCDVNGVIGEQVFVASHVICTLPIGVLQRNYTTLFSPNLPARKVKAMLNISAGTTAKYFVSWDNPWRVKNDTPIMLAWTRKELNSMTLPEEWYKGIMEFSAEDSSHGSLMIAWIGGIAAKVADTLPDDQIIKDIGNVLRRFTGNPDVPDPDHLIRQCWTTDEFTLGAYSYPKVGAGCKVFKQMGEPIPSKNSPRIMFAGEATSLNLWSYLHGARLTGIIEADRVVKILKK